MQKMMDQNFEIRILIFENFFKFSKRRRAVPLRLIWTVMVAAKLDHSRTDRQTRLKIRALQVCNRANSKQEKNEIEQIYIVPDVTSESLT